MVVVTVVEVVVVAGVVVVELSHKMSWLLLLMTSSGGAGSVGGLSGSMPRRHGARDASLSMRVEIACRARRRRFGRTSARRPRRRMSKPSCTIRWGLAKLTFGLRGNVRVRFEWRGKEWEDFYGAHFFFIRNRRNGGRHT